VAVPPSWNRTAEPYRLHGFELSYFTAKVRPALRYKVLWYEELRADLAEVIDKSGLGFIPIVETPDGEVWQDTSEILERLERAHPEPPLLPTTPRQRIAAGLIELYCDEIALLPAMHYRWGSERGVRDARARFGAAMGFELAANAAPRMAKARLALGANAETGPAIEEHTRELLAVLCAHFAAHPYLLGERMSLADCALMGPCYAHLYNDIVSRELLVESAPAVVGWIERCNYPGVSRQGSWLPDDALSPTLLDVLSVMGRDAAPALLACSQRIDEWIDGLDELPERVPRAVGKVRFEFGGRPIEAMARPYTAWMLDRTLGVFHALSRRDRGAVLDALAATGWPALFAHTPRHRVTKRGVALAIERGAP
jgi:glutathione S-transferase